MKAVWTQRTTSDMIGLFSQSGDQGEQSEDISELQKQIAALSEPQVKKSKFLGDISQLPLWRIRLIEIIEDERFDLLLGAVIVFNTALIIADTDATADGGSSPLWVETASYCLLVIYCIELILRLASYECNFFKDGWNIMDFFVIGSDIVLLILGIILGDMPKVAILRMFRLVRICRTFKLASKFKELNFLLTAFASAIRAIFWGVTLVMIVCTVWAILAVQLIHDVNKEVTKEGFWARNYCERCPKAFRTVFAALMTIFQSVVAGDSWGLLSLPIIEHAPYTAILLLCILVSVSIGILNLIMAVVVERALASTAVPESPEEKHRKYVTAAAQLLELCVQLDKDGSRCLSKQEINTGFEAPEFSDAMRVMGLNKEDMNFLFEAVDQDRSGEVNYLEFVAYLMKYRDADQRTLLFEIMKLSSRVQKLQARKRQRYALALEYESIVLEAIAVLKHWLLPVEQECKDRGIFREELPAEEQKQSGDMPPSSLSASFLEERAKPAVNIDKDACAVYCI